MSPETGCGKPRSEPADSSHGESRSHAEPLSPQPRSRAGGAATGSRRNSPGAPGWTSGGRQPLPRLPAPPPGLRAPPPEPAHPALVPAALQGALWGARGRAQRREGPARASPRPWCQLGRAGSAAPHLSTNGSGTASVGPDGTRRDRTRHAAAPNSEQVRSRGAPNVTAAGSAASSESPDHPGNAHRAGPGEGRRHSTSPAPSRGLWEPPGALPRGRRRGRGGRVRAAVQGPLSPEWIPETLTGAPLRLDQFSETPKATASPLLQVPGRQGLCTRGTLFRARRAGFAMRGCTSGLLRQDPARSRGPRAVLERTGPEADN